DRGKFLDLERERHFPEQIDRVLETAGIIRGRADRLTHLLHFVIENRFEKIRRDLAAVGEASAVIDPLPDLRATDLGGGCILHQMIERHRATAAQPGFDVLYADANVE